MAFFCTNRRFNARDGDPDQALGKDEGVLGVNAVAYKAMWDNRDYRIASDEGAAPNSTDFRKWGLAEAQGFDPFLPAQYHDALRGVLPAGDRWNPDRTIVLTSSTDTIEKHIKHRNRPHEDVVDMVRRFRLIDAEFRRLAAEYPNTIVINRDRMEFHSRESLTAIVHAADLPMFREIPYTVIE